MEVSVETSQRQTRFAEYSSTCLPQRSHWPQVGQLPSMGSTGGGTEGKEVFLSYAGTRQVWSPLFCLVWRKTLNFGVLH